MDADDPKSFELKSRFQIGGYPTLVLASVKASGDQASLTEMGRVIGYYPFPEFSARIRGMMDRGSAGIDERIAKGRQNLLSDLKEKIDLEIEKKNFDSAKAAIDQARAIAGESLELKIDEWIWLSKKEPESKFKDSDAVLGEALRDREKLPSAVILKLAQFLSGITETLQRKQIELAVQLIEAVKKRAEPGSLQIPGTEYSEIDLELLSADFYRANKDEAAAEVCRSRAIEGYRKLTARGAGHDSRAHHLEFAALLAESGKSEEALSIYDRFIQKFPREFTFYYAKARVQLERKNLKEARVLSEQAVQYAYGDNLIRAMDRLLKVMRAQGELDFAYRRGSEFLQGINVDPKLKVRTDRYVALLKTTLSEIKKETRNP
jgi:tetratricopeptide (TPR) repeat protein